MGGALSEVTGGVQSRRRVPLGVGLESGHIGGWRF